MVVIEPLGDNAVLVQFGDELTEDVQKDVTDFSRMLSKTDIQGFVEYIPAYTTVTIIYNPLYFLNSNGNIPYENCKAFIEELLLSNIETDDDIGNQIITIPVCYGGVFGPDLDSVAQFHSLHNEEVIKLHTDTIYTVAMIGFAPGFPYLSGLNKKIATPRLATPRKEVAKGSVGIAGIQTGIYSITSPGGWQIIGRTPMTLFNHKKHPPSFLKQGNKVQFKRINEDQFHTWGVEKDEYFS